MDLVRRPAAVPSHFRPVRLVPDAGLVLWADAPAAKFIPAFRAAWLKLPWDARRALLSGWYAAGDDCPVVALSRSLMNGWRALCSADGLLLAFRADCVALPADQLQALVAHELAHAGRCLTGCPGADDEAAVDRLAESRGFAVRELRRKAGAP